MIEVRLRETMAAYGERHGERLTYHKLAERTGVSKATLEAIGSRPDYNTTLFVLDSLCTYLECDISQLLVYRKD